MAGDGDQWLIVRNERGRELVTLLGDEVRTSPLRSRGDRRRVVAMVVGLLERQKGGLPVRRAPRWARPLIGWLQARFGPKGLELSLIHI